MAFEADPDRGKEVLKLDREHVFQSWSAQGSLNPMLIQGAEGSYVWDYDGKRYIDFSSQLVNTNIGHQHPKLIKAIQEQAGRLPDALVACVGGGSNAMGLFYPFLNDEDVKMYGVEAAGDGIETGRHSAPLNAGHVGVLHGNRTYLMSDAQGQIIETHSISAGLDYPGVGPEHSFLKDMQRVNYVPITDNEALQGFRDLTQIEGIIPALESAHAMAYVTKLAPTMSKDQIIIATVSGRGDKDLMTVARLDGVEMVEM